jgi:adenosine 3'-phospho 5'-phosphosulfate transporter B3
VHFSWNWFSYGLLAYMPSFFKGALGLSLTKSSVLSILPYASTICVMLFVGSICDGLVKSGKMNLTQVRKFSQSVCFLGGAIASTGIAATLLTINPVVGATTTQFVTIMGLLIATFGCGAFCRTGLFCTHQDISPKYASIMLGMTNTVAAIASSLATYCIGLLLDYTNNNWALALFAPMVVLNIVSTLIFVSFYKSDPDDFDSLEAGGSQVKVAAISCEPVPEDEQPKKETPAPVAGSSPVKVAAVEAEEEFPQEKLVLFGITCPDNKGAQFAILTVGSLVCSIGFSALQEGVTRVPGFKFSGWMTLITTVAYMACALIEMVATKGKIEKKGSWSNYVALSTMTFGGMYATNYALKFLNYATRIVAKSSKVIPVMIFSTIINGKKYNWKEWGAVGCLVIGIILFTLGDVASMPSFSPIGIVLITAALCIDAITSNFEERVFFRVKTPSSHSEVLFFASLFGSIWSFASCYLTGELGPAIAHSVANPSVVPSILSFSVLGYASVSFILGMIKFFGATEAEIVKSCRKVLSIVISFVLFPKALNWKYIAGFVVVVASIAWTFQLKQEKIKAKEAAKLAAAKEA